MPQATTRRDLIATLPGLAVLLATEPAAGRAPPTAAPPRPAFQAAQSPAPQAPVATPPASTTPTPAVPATTNNGNARSRERESR